MVSSVTVQKVVLPRSFAYREMPWNPLNELLRGILADVKAGRTISGKVEVHAVKPGKRLPSCMMKSNSLASAKRRFGAAVTAAHPSLIDKCSTELNGTIILSALARAFLCLGHLDGAGMKSQ